VALQRNARGPLLSSPGYAIRYAAVDKLLKAHPQLDAAVKDLTAKR